MPGAAPRARSRPWRQGRAAGAALTAREAAQPTLLPAACSDGACAGSQSVAGSGSPSAQSEIENQQTPEPGLATAWAVRCIGHGNVTVHCATCTQLVIEPAVPGWLWPRSDLASDCDEWDRLGAQDGPPLRRSVASWPARRQQLAPAGSSGSSWNDGNRLAIAHGKPGECALRQALPLPDSRSIAGSDVIAVCSSLHAKRQTAESGFRSRPLPAPDAPVTRADGAASRLRTPTAPRRRRASPGVSGTSLAASGSRAAHCGVACHPAQCRGRGPCRGFRSPVPQSAQTGEPLPSCQNNVVSGESRIAGWPARQQPCRSVRRAGQRKVSHKQFIRLDSAVRQWRWEPYSTSLQADHARSTVAPSDAVPTGGAGDGFQVQFLQCVTECLVAFRRLRRPALRSSHQARCEASVPQAEAPAAGLAGVHRRSSRSKAASSPSSLRMTATSATLCGLPRAGRRA